MFVSDKAFSWFTVSQDAFEYLRQENASLKSERDCLKAENSQLRIAADWHRAKINQLELERASLLHKAYQISIPAPQIMRQDMNPEQKLKQFSFDDMGEEMAKALGLPFHGSNDN